MKRFDISRAGVTRIVLLIGPWAVKLPRFGYGWRLGLQGLLANLQEAAFATTGWQELCPVIFSLPGGWLVVMRRARPLTEAEWRSFDPRTIKYPNDDLSRIIPVEPKCDSFGWLDGRIVALDYGS